MMVAPSDDDVTTCPLCHVTVTNANELQLHYLQSCPGYDNDGNACMQYACTCMYLICICMCIYMCG